MKGQSLSDRMKEYEMCQNVNLPENLPVIIRLDGRAFHTMTRGLQKPYDEEFIKMMNYIAKDICENELQNCKLAYLQSDEISFLVYKSPLASNWFGNNIQKMCSIVSSRASAIATEYNLKYHQVFDIRKPIIFDCRAFVLPEKEVCNYFIWRQQDWTRNSLQMYCRKYYSEKEMYKKNQQDMHEMIYQKGDNWNDLLTYLKRGRCIISIKEWKSDTNTTLEQPIERTIWKLDNEIPIFTQDREYIERYLWEV